MEPRPIRLFDPGAAWTPILQRVQAALADLVAGGIFIDGDPVASFERAVEQRLGIAHAVGCANGTSALQLALIAGGIEPGDEVITVANTYYATAHAIRAVGAVPVFVEIDAKSAQMDCVAAAQAVTPRTAAILPVHLYGWPAPSRALRALADARDLLLVEDAAHAFGGGPHGRAYGSLADFACFSFYPTKTLGALGDAGLVATPHADAAARARSLRYFGDDSRTKFDPNALHAKLDTLQATLLSLRLERFDADKAGRAERAAIYAARFADTAVDRVVGATDDACPYVYPVRVPARDRFLATLRSYGIHAGVHYATDLHREPEFGGASAGTLPITERHNARVVSLPVYSELPLDDVHRVADAVLASLCAAQPTR